MTRSGTWRTATGSHPPRGEPGHALGDLSARAAWGSTPSRQLNAAKRNLPQSALEQFKGLARIRRTVRRWAPPMRRRRFATSKAPRRCPLLPSPGRAISPWDSRWPRMKDRGHVSESPAAWEATSAHKARSTRTRPRTSPGRLIRRHRGGRLTWPPTVDQGPTGTPIRDLRGGAGPRTARAWGPERAPEDRVTGRCSRRR